MRQLITGGIALAMAITANAAELTAKENAIIDIGAWTARGEQDKLGAAFKAGFGAGLTLNEAKELVGQLYAYCGFPRALNAAATLMKIEGYGLTRRRGDAELMFHSICRRVGRGRDWEKLLKYNWGRCSIRKILPAYCTRILPTSQFVGGLLTLTI